MSSKVFRTESLDLAAYLVTAGFLPEIVRAEDLRRALFEFKETEELRQAIVSYEGGASLPARRLLNVRSRLYREASQVVKGGVGI
ncbi:MAG TPA: DUF5659 domain-containing protein [Geobacteraceae bacterium]|nr:DUF5659 domain-containing protein [Geobacteraceae bacterium]